MLFSAFNNLKMPVHPERLGKKIHFRTSRPTLPVYLSCRSQPRMHSYFSQGSQHNVSCTRDRLSKLTGLVSNKTISDFALSPFAGFVSKKERSWLIKIQQLQCQGSGNPYEDDFYYTVCFVFYSFLFYVCLSDNIVNDLIDTLCLITYLREAHWFLIHILYNEYITILSLQQ